MRLRTELLVAVAVLVVVGALARTPAGRFVLPLASLAVLAGLGYLLTRDAAYARTTLGTRTRMLDTPAVGDGSEVAEAGAKPNPNACIDCGAPATTTRRFVREFVVLGVPVVLLDDGTNRYCDDCLP